MSAPLPLPIWPWPLSEERLLLLRSAKATISTDIKIVPIGAEPGVEGRVLAFGEVPPFICETVLVRAENVGRVDSVSNALSFLLEAPEGEPRLFTKTDWLSAAMGVPVVFAGEVEHISSAS